MIDRDKVIRGLISCKNHWCAECPYAMPGMKCCGRDQLYDDALALLREQEPRVLTLDEVRKNREWVVWIECDYSKTQNIGQYRGHVNWHNKHLSDWERFLTIGSGEYLFRESDKYGKTWRCWNACPSEQQMRDTPWEGDSDAE
jgi:hypothetical protein